MTPGLTDHIRHATLSAKPRPRVTLWPLRLAWWALGFICGLLYGGPL